MRFVLSNPGSAVCWRMRLRIIIVPPETRTRARVISKTTSPFRIKFRPPVEPRLVSCRPSARWPRVSNQAGAAPNRMPVKTESASANPSVVRSTLACSKMCISGGATRFSMGTVQ